MWTDQGLLEMYLIISCFISATFSVPFPLPATERGVGFGWSSMLLPSASRIRLHTKTNCWPGLYQTFHRKTSKVKQGFCARPGWGSLRISWKECYNGGGNPFTCSNLDNSVKAQRVSVKQRESNTASIVKWEEKHYGAYRGGIETALLICDSWPCCRFN